MDLRRPLFAGATLAVSELAVTFAGGWSLFLGGGERTRYLLGALASCFALALAAWGLGALVLPIVMGFVAELFGVETSFLIIGAGLLAIVAVLALWTARNPAFNRPH